MRQKWRNSINRFAEAMTIFAVLCAGMYPVLHLGRPWLAYWLFPYPSSFGVWPQFRSPLVWDMFAVTTYLTVSVLFWGVALIPDYASLRDRAKKPWLKRVFGVISLGWSGDAEHWHRFQQVYLILAALATALVISVHSIVGLDFAVAQLPQWHSTITPPYFVAGAIFSGFAMLLLLVIPLRAWYRLKDLITMKHIDWMAKIMLATSLIVGYSYLVETFLAYYKNDIYERSVMNALWFGDFRGLHYTIVLINAILPNAFWWKKVRQNIPVVFMISAAVVVGMWLERYEIVTVALRDNFMPSAWGIFRPTFWDYCTLFGTLGFFVMMLFLLIRAVPPITVFEMRETLEEEHPEVAEPIQEPAALHYYGDRVMGALVAFGGPHDLLREIKRVREAGFTRIRAFTPYPVKQLPKALGINSDRMKWIMFFGAVFGAGAAYLLQWYVNVVDYPLNVGGRPYHSWPAFIPVTYECTILFASLAGFFGMLSANGLPRIADQIFTAPGIDRASLDRFILYVSADDPQFDLRDTPVFLDGGVSPREEVLA
jgi:Ni/Fe-hydrogenase subunit HybB-like protein